jgi:hypothetical protein
MAFACAVEGDFSGASDFKSFGHGFAGLDSFGSAHIGKFWVKELSLGPMLRTFAAFSAGADKFDDFRHFKADFVFDDFGEGDIGHAHRAGVHDERAIDAAATGGELAHAAGHHVDQHVGVENFCQGLLDEISVHIGFDSVVTILRRRKPVNSSPVSQVSGTIATTYKMFRLCSKDMGKGLLPEVLCIVKAGGFKYLGGVEGAWRSG